MNIQNKIEQGHYNNKLDFAKDKKAYREETSNLKRKFREDLAEEFGVTDHPKEEQLFNIAWENGHSSGYNEVWGEYSDLVELIN